MFACQSRKHRFEVIRVFHTIIRGQLHAGKNDGGRCSSTPLNDPLKVGLGFPEAETAEAVVGTKLQNYDLGSALEDPVYSPQPASCRVSAYAGIDHAVLKTLSIKPALQLGGVGVFLNDPETGRQTVTEGNNERAIAGRMDGSRCLDTGAKPGRCQAKKQRSSEAERTDRGCGASDYHGTPV